MVVVVTFDNEILGAGEFWRGTVDDIRSIRNIVARRLAAKVFAGQVTTASDGMWTASQVQP